MAVNINDMTRDQVVSQISAYEAQIARNCERWASSDVSESGLSERAAHAGHLMAKMRLAIIDDGGAVFPVLVDSTGDIAATRTERGKWGAVWVDRRSQPWVFVPYGKEARKGYRVEDRLIPAKVTMSALFMPGVDPL